MKDISTKLRVIYAPFIIVAICTILGYNLFRWIFDLRLGILPLKEDLLNFWLPFTLPWIPILIWLRRRVRLLKLKGKNGKDGYFFYQFLMACAIAVPIIISQNYLEKALFPLITAPTLAEITDLNSEKYFDIDSFAVNHNAALPYITGRTSGRNNESLTFYLYLSVPFKEDTRSLWYGVEYSKRVSNYGSDEKKNEAYQTFIKQSLREFESYDFSKAWYFERLGRSDDRDGFVEAVRERFPSTKAAEVVVLVPHKEEFNARLGNTFPWIFGSFGIGACVMLLMVLIPSFDHAEYKRFMAKRPLKEDELRDILSYLNPYGKYKATAILLNLNILVFLLMVLSGINIISPTPRELLEIGAIRRAEVESGEYWRMFASMFIHGGLMHLIMNLFGLGMGAVLLEPILKPLKLFILYVMCGLCAAYFSIWWHDHTISVGASGAIFGLYGIILAFTVLRVFPEGIRGIAWLMLGLFAGLGLLFGMLGGIDNAAHIGGLLSGFVAGLLHTLIRQKSLTNTV